MWRVRSRSVIVGVVLTVASAAWPGDVGSQQPSPPAATDALLIRAEDLIYQGAFRLPRGVFGGSSFDFGGTALAFNSARGSLFIVGHDHHQQVAEIAVPAVRNASQLRDLETATMLQPFTDATEGKLGMVGPNTVKIGGLLPYQGQLYLTAFLYYDGDGSQKLSHFVSGTDLGVKGDVKGPYQVGEIGAGFVSGYFGLVPAAWQAALGGPVLNGNCCLSIISRTSYGPAAFTFDPLMLGVKTPAPIKPLVYYPSAHPLLDRGVSGDGWSNTSTLFNGTSAVTGVVFPNGTRSLLFFGRHGLGKFCYGEGHECNDPVQDSKGGHAAPYQQYVWAYDANHLANVKTRRRDPWTVKPYAVWELKLPFANGGGHLRGATYDPDTNRLFVSQAYGDGDLPLIHVLTVKAP